MQKDSMLQPIQENFAVSFSYTTYFTRNLFAKENILFKEIITNENPHQLKKIFFVIDQGVTNTFPQLISDIMSYGELNKDSIQLVADPMILTGGEGAKNSMEQVTAIYDAVNTYGICRHSYIVAIGGGAFLDMVGFAAATAHRGVRLIRVPTTVLSQDDSGVGVKNGVNFSGKKNFVGTFAPPFAVINDMLFIESLPDREWRSGLSEALKVALLKDEAFFTFIEQNAQNLCNRDMEAMQQVIYQGAKLHMQHIAHNGDPFETGSSRPLDLGHWSAHKLEQLTNFSLRHGEAVALGIALDSTYAYLKGFLDKKDWERILYTIQSLKLAIFTDQMNQHLDNPSHQGSVLWGLEEFREHLGGILTIPLLRKIGDPFDVNEIDLQMMIESIHLLKKVAQEKGKEEAYEEKTTLSSYPTGTY